MSKRFHREQLLQKVRTLSKLVGAAAADADAVDRFYPVLTQTAWDERVILGSGGRTARWSVEFDAPDREHPLRVLDPSLPRALSFACGKVHGTPSPAPGPWLGVFVPLLERMMEEGAKVVVELPSSVLISTPDSGEPIREEGGELASTLWRATQQYAQRFWTTALAQIQEDLP